MTQDELKTEITALYSNGYVGLEMLDALMQLIDSAIAEAKPSDAEISEAIAWLGVRRNVHEAYTNAHPSAGTHYYDLAIAAMRSYQKPEQCEVCYSCHQCSVGGGHDCGKDDCNFTPLQNYCENCGRKLGERK